MKTILVDASSLLFPTALTSGDLELCTSTGVQTTYTYTFLSDILDLACTFDSNRFIIVFDSKKNNRKKIFPEYKAKRRERDPKTVERLNSMFDEFPRLKDTLIKIGFPVYTEDGFESDDVIASFVYSNPEEQFIIVSSDHDMYQLMSERVELYRPYNGRFFTMDDFNAKYPGVHPKDYWKILSLSGCRTDEVPSVVGERTAYKFVAGILSKDSVYYHRIKEGKDKVQFARRLVQLPLEGTPEYKVPQFSLNKDAFFELCTEYEFYHFLEKDYTRWNKVLSKGDTV